MSALTFIGLSLGAPPLAAASALVVAIGRLDRALGVELRVLDRTTDTILSALEPATSTEVRGYLDAIRRDQGAVIQLTPEAMDLFQAGVEDRPGVRYQCTCALAPPPTPGTLARSLVTVSPWKAISSTLFTTMYGITARYDERYPCAAPAVGVQAEKAFLDAFGKLPGARANDGVVPALSQIWGEVVWAGYGDHLDVLGHFPGNGGPKQPLWQSVLGRLRRSAPADESAVAEAAAEAGGVAADPTADARNVDWLLSGSRFDETTFDALMDALAKGMLYSS